MYLLGIYAYKLQYPTEITTRRNYETYNFNKSSFNDRIRELEALIELTLRPGQVEALQSQRCSIAVGSYQYIVLDQTVAASI